MGVTTFGGGQTQIEQQYLTTLAYFEPSPAEARALVKEAADLHQTLDARDSSLVDKTRATERLKTVERLIQTGRMAKRQADQVPQQARQADAGHYMRNRNGDYLYVQNATPEPSRQEFMPIATNTNKSGGSGQQWPESFSERTALLQAAVAELRQAGVA